MSITSPHEQNNWLTCTHCGARQQMPSTPAGTEAFCFQCNSSMCSHVPRGVQRTMALSLAALILFIPANVLPILSMSKFGYETKSTIWQGGVALWKSGTPGIAVLVLLCSIGIPLAKITGLLYLCATWKNNPSTRNSHLLRLIEAIGRWSMLDVFLVAILVALVKLGALATVAPQLGLVAFCAVVVLTMVASSNFDSRLLWKTEASE